MKKKQIKKVVSKKSESKLLPTNNNQATMVVKIISIFEYVGAGFSILFGLMLLLFRQVFLQMLPLAEMPQIPAILLSSAFIIMAIIMLVAGLFAIFVVRALWNHKNWARIVSLVVSSIGLLFALFSLPQGILGLIIHGAVVYFLGFDKNVVALFK